MKNNIKDNIEINIDIFALKILALLICRDSIKLKASLLFDTIIG